MGGTIHVTSSASPDSTDGLAGRPGYTSVSTAAGPAGTFTPDQLIIHSGDVARVRELLAADPSPGMRLTALPDFTPPPGVQVSSDPARSDPPAVALLEFDGAALAATQSVVLPEASEDGTVDSAAGLGTLARAAWLQQQGIRASIDWAGAAHTLPATSTSDPASGDTNPDAYTWWEFNGPTAFVRAWRLIAAHRLLGGALAPVQVAMVDSGFWYDTTTGACLGTPPEFPGAVPQLDVVDGRPRAGGPALEPPVTWHGQATTGVAMAPHGNGAGTAGAAGNVPDVVTPFLFRTTYNHWKVLSALKTATAWGCDVVNMSFGIKPGTFLGMDSFPDDAWNEVFRWAGDAGVVIVCSAGNDNLNLHELNTRPATRTERVITVGALAVNVPDRAWVGTNGSGSNWNESVDLWAPGQSLHSGPEPTNPSGSRPSGTSGSAPLVSAAAALVKAVKPQASPAEVWRLLSSTAYAAPAADGKVGLRLNAGEAVWQALGARFPDDPDDATGGNGSAASARPMAAGSGAGVWVPAGPRPRALSPAGDLDFHSFRVNGPSTVRVLVDHAVDLVPGAEEARVYLRKGDDPDTQVPVPRISRTHLELVVEGASPDLYRVLVSGAQVIYDLQVLVSEQPLEGDWYEPNDTPETAQPMSFRPAPGGVAWIPPLGPDRSWEATLPTGDVDWFHVTEVPAQVGHLFAWVRASSTDAPITIEVFTEDFQRHWVATGFEDSGSLELPSPSCWIKISSNASTRYSLLIHQSVDFTSIPGWPI